VEDERALDRFGLSEPLDLEPRFVGIRIAPRREHDGHARLRGQVRLVEGEVPLGAREAQLGEIGAEPRNDHLRLWVAEPRVELEHLGTLVGEHQSGIQHAGIACALGIHRAYGANEYVVQDLGRRHVADERHR
jgi:hypothetical protein